MKVALVTLGCDKNTVDSERYLGALMEQGAEPVPDPAAADVIVVNTCGFIDAAKREFSMRRALEILSGLR